MNKALLLSGGIDSISLAFMLKPQVAITIDYGQRPAFAEIRASTQVCKELNIAHEIISVDCSQLGSGDLSASKALAIAPSSEWWPFRNQLLVTLASMKAVSLNVNQLIVGSVKTDGFHKDGTQEFYSKISRLMEYQEGKIQVACPAINLTSDELVRKANVPLSILLWAHSCHTANEACGCCPGCLKHLTVKQRLGLD